MVPTERWLVILGVGLGVYGSVVAGAPGAGHLAKSIWRWLHGQARAASITVAATYRRIAVKIPGLRASANAHPVRIELGTMSLQIRMPPVSVRGGLGLAGVPGDGAVEQQIEALAERTEQLNTYIEDTAEALRATTHKLSGRVDDIAKRGQSDLREEVAHVRAESMQVAAAGLPGIAMSIVLVGIPSMLLPPGGWGWLSFSLFTLVAMVHVRLTYDQAWRDIKKGWRSASKPQGEPDSVPT